MRTLGNQEKHRLSPRAVRLFLFKHQLCRNLAVQCELTPRPSPSELGLELQKAWYHLEASQPQQTEPQRSIAKIAAQAA